MTLPQWTPTPRELADLELALHGALPGDHAFSVATSSDFAESVEDAFELIDPEGVPLASLAVEGRADEVDAVSLSGPTTPLSPGEYGPFRRYHRAPADVRAEEPDTFAVPVVAPPTLADIEAINTRAKESGRTPLLLVCTGPGAPQGVSAPALVRA
ncbi:MAG: hypothetical protein L0K86_16255, partial [Actinomycetia bacterium]|nr:hypothetical protein [Actinomycetes bacterium]